VSSLENVTGHKITSRLEKISDLHMYGGALPKVTKFIAHTVIIISFTSSFHDFASRSDNVYTLFYVQ